MKWVSKLVEEGQIKPPKGYPDKVSASDAKAVLDKQFNKGKSVRGGKPARRSKRR
ncbi:hypothetical protein [uncultured Roseibium sp.]|uniref:hypothetical protein n=1 Tax=uncultured Roseibium sp. TaxID=1936171 RepID=UPI002630098D|nr:hypothetical protein [uncultured Roseibium sp.]